MSEKTKEKKGKNIFARIFGAIAKFFRDAASETKKVVWPSAKQVFNNTVVVLAVCIISGAFLFCVDTVFAELVKLLVKA